MRAITPRARRSSMLLAATAMAAGSLLFNSCVFADSCTPDYCYGPLNILIQEELIPNDAHVELVVKGKVLECSTDYSSSNECYMLGTNEGFGWNGSIHFEVKSLPKAISIRIVSSVGDEIARYDETPVYLVGNTGSCSTECHKNATVRIGEFESQ